MLDITPIPAFNDNYIWLISRPGERQAWVVDPGDAAPVEAALTARQLDLGGILVTHHHPDHTGGLARLTASRVIPVLGPDNPHIKQLTERLAAGDSAEVLGTRFSVLETPGHTLDHIVYYAAAHQPPLLFSGDTLFAAGCGRLFEGAPAQMVRSLSQLRELPADTRFYCAHEYTLANLDFAAAVEPDNAAIQARTERCRQQRAAGQPTVPASIAEELASNPFLRWDQGAVCRAAARRAGHQLNRPEAVFAEIRKWKDHF